EALAVGGGRGGRLQMFGRRLPNRRAEGTEEDGGGHRTQVVRKATVAHQLQQLPLTALRAPQRLRRSTPQRKRLPRRGDNLRQHPDPLRATRSTEQGQRRLRI